MLSYFKGRAFDRLRHLSFYSRRTLSPELIEGSKGRFMAAKVWKLYQSPKSFFMAFERASL